METIIPLMMASIIDDGVEAGDIHHIYMMGIWMVVVAGASLFAGTMGGVFGAKASTGFARNLREKLCMRTYRHFHLQILINTVLPDWLHD